MTREEQKEKVRNEMRSRLAALEPGFCARASAEICRRLSASPFWANARSVLFYSALPSEPNLSTLALQALEEGKKCVFPKVQGPNLELYPVAALCDLKRGAYGILEPEDAGAEKVSCVDLALVPGLAFDRRGFRLGRGKGYYDRLLPGLGGAAAGCCFDLQRVDRLPVLGHDARLDGLATELGVELFAGG
ncbi:MAG: 5-formyltetrahydrofolate cyclo-ligase [Methylacidiphilales bacterium]|nr:5-formyltetrahydrofolate cyclo-ligase [Candidatus Methylacidiphilales bacterium]